MKKILILLAILGLSYQSVNAQSDSPFKSEKMCFSIGFLQGGGSLVGLDFEYMVSERIGVQAGAGYLGGGVGINYHFQPAVRSSFASLQYWHQEFANEKRQLVGPNVVYRGNRWFTAQFGLGYRLDNSPDGRTIGDTQFMFAIGGYFVK